MTTAPLHRALLTIGVFGLGAALSGAQGITFTRIADTNTTIPGGVGTFISLSQPSLNDGDVAFLGSGAIPPGCITGEGIYRARNGTLQAIADGCTAMPGCPLLFVGFSQPALGAGGATFSGAANYAGFNCRGIYSRNGNGPLTIVADPATPDPGGFGFLTEFFFVGREGRTIGFSAWTTLGGPAVYIRTNALTLVANTTTLVPGTNQPFTFFQPNVSAGATEVAFAGENAQRSGVYTGASPTTLQTVADTTTAIPGGTGTFTSFGDRPSTDRGATVFYGQGTAGQQGIYTDLGGTLRRVADLSTPIPNGTGTFTGFTFFYGPSIDGNRIAFRGTGAGGQIGIYLFSARTNTLTRVVDLSSLLVNDPNLTLVDLAIDEQALDGDKLGFLAVYETGVPLQFYSAVFVASL